MENKLILELEKSEKEAWKNTISTLRTKILKRPIDYVERATAELNITKDTFKESISNTILSIREKSWSYYIDDEANFHKLAMHELVSKRDIPKSILSVSIDQIITSNDDLKDKIADVVGDFTGRIMPYIYELSLSTTNSRRSRSGTTFEEIIYFTMRAFEYPYADQAHLGKKFFTDTGIGKKVDMIIPSKEAYLKNRSQCQIVTMKTSLRERWQEVVEEISRTNIPHIYLFTLDESLTENVMSVLANHNITLVTYEKAKDRLAQYDNIISFEEYFEKEIIHLLDYWK